jgi:hypothetical protein
MKSQIYKWMALVAMLFCLVLVVTNATAKKGGNKPQDDPCANQQSFSPDFVFWRDTGSRNSPEVTIFVAESDSGCEQLLVSFPIDERERIKNLKFSSIEDVNGNVVFGRVVWTNELGLTAEHVWMQDFEIVGTDVEQAGTPVRILRNELMDGVDLREDISDLDLSPDTQKLVYEYSLRDYLAGQIHHSFHILDIDDCVDASCGFSTAHAYELETSSDEVRQGYGGFSDPSWGPFGNRIYVVRWFKEYHELQFFDLEWNAPNDPPNFSSGLLLPRTSNWFSKPVSGIMEGTETEYMAIQDEFSVKTGACKGIYLINLESCNPMCSWPEPSFAGAYPSWTKVGKLVHLYDGWKPHGGCRLPTIGLWNATDNSLEKLIDGVAPNAAGGFVE